MSVTNENRLLRVKDILGDLYAKPPILPILPISRAAWFAGIQKGLYPKPFKLGARMSVWRASDIYKFIDAAERTSK